MSFFKTIDELQAVASVNNSLDIATVRPSLTEAADTHVLPILGEAFYETIQAAYDAATDASALSGWQAELVKLIQRAVGPLAMVDAIDEIQLQISDAGVQVPVTATRETARQWQILAYKKKQAARGQTALDALLRYLEARIDDAAFAEWATSPAALAAAELLIPTAAEFDRSVDIRGSRLTFRALLPLIRKSEAFDLEPVLGADFLAVLRELANDRDLTDAAPEKALLTDYIRPALAHLTLARALRERTFRLNGDALESVVFFDDPDGTRRQPAPLNAAELLATARGRADDDARTYVARLTAYLRTTASATVFAAYFSSDRYNAGKPAPDPVAAAMAEPTAPVFFGL